MDVLVSIATMNSVALLEDCLASIPGAAVTTAVTVVVVDNCSADGTADMVRLRYPDTRLLENDRPRGFGANHNRVLLDDGRPATEFVMFLNDDTVLHEGAIDRLVDAARSEPTTGALAPLVVGVDKREQPVAMLDMSQTALVCNALLSRPAPRFRPERADWLNGCCVLVPTAVLDYVGAFDERFFMYSEDVDLSIRIRRAGYRLWQFRGASITHLGGATTGQPLHSTTMAQQFGRSYYLLLRKHRGPTVALVSTTALRIAMTARASIDLLRGGRNTQRRSAARTKLSAARRSWRKPAFSDQET